MKEGEPFPSEILYTHGTFQDQGSRGGYLHNASETDAEQSNLK